MKISPVGAELLHADWRTDGQWEGHTEGRRDAQADKETLRS